MDNMNYAAWQQQPGGNGGGNKPAGGNAQMEMYLKMQQQQGMSAAGGQQQQSGHQQQGSGDPSQQQQQQGGAPAFASAGMLMQQQHLPQQQFANMQQGMQQPQGFNGNMMMGMMMPQDMQQQQHAMNGPNALSALSDAADNMNVHQRYQNLLLQQLFLNQQQSDMFGAAGMGAAAMNGNVNSNASLQQRLMMMNSSAGQVPGWVGGMPAVAVPDPPAAGKRGRKKKRRDKSRPSQPLSAYNLFFKDQRLKMLEQAQKIKEEEAAAAEAKKEAGEDGSEGGDDGVKKEGGDDDGDKKEDGKSEGGKPPGKIGFEKMAKTIAKAWRAISKEDLAVYEARAQEDQKRYKQELAVYLQKKRQDGGGPQ